MKENSFSNNWGFILASVGSAVGLGNILSFPFKLKNGGIVFLIFYFVLVLVVGIPLLIAEIGIGRKTKSSVLNAYKKISPGLKKVGIISVVSPLIILSYYVVLSGYCVKYLFINISNLFSDNFTFDTNLLFVNTITDIPQSVLFSLLFLLATFYISAKGIINGIERFNTFAMPALFIILVVAAVRSLNSNYVIDGINNILSFPKHNIDLIKKFSSAGEQVFFSLSIATGTMLTYGSFMKHNQNIIKSSLLIAVADTIVALLSGIAVIPATVSINENSGYELIFVFMQKMFNTDGKIGSIFGIMFFMLIIIAALTSAVAFLEVGVCALIDFGAKTRKNALLFCGILLFIPIMIITIDAMGKNNLTAFLKVILGERNFNKSVLSLFTFIVEGILMPLAALILSVYIGWFGVDKKIISEIKIDDKNCIYKKIFKYLFKFVIPIVLIIIILGQIFYYLW